MGIKKNFIYNSILTLSQYIIGLITFPYISRVLGVSNIGIVSFIDNSINYFILFSTMGVGIIGAREIAKYKQNKCKLNSVFSSLLSLSMIYTGIVLVLFLLAVLFIPQFHNYKYLFFIGSAKLIFSAFLIEWFYRGIEDFKYIAFRNIAIKIAYACAIFIFVNEKEDYTIYFVLTIGTVIINAVINSFHARKFVDFNTQSIFLKPYFKQSLWLGSYAILTSMYTTFNVMYLGFATDTIQVGYYWAALKIYTIILGFFTAFTAVMSPRMSSLLSQGDEESFKIMINKSLRILFTICFPLIIASVMFSKEIILILCGNGYDGAVLPMQIIMPLILVVGVAQILAIQVLIPLQKDKLILNASIIGASSGILLNLLIVKLYGSIGTSFVLVFSELLVTSYYIYKVRKNKIIDLNWKPLAQNIVYSIPYIIICTSAKYIFDNEFSIIGFSFVLSGVYFVLIELFVLKNTKLNNIIKSKISSK